MESITTNKWLGRWLAGRILYIGDQLLLLDGKGGVLPVTADDISSVRVAVVGKAHYFETIKHFPFHKVAEIKSAVFLDQNAYSPFPATRCMIRKIHQADDGATVNLWMLSPEAAEIIDRRFLSLVIPESALFSFYTENISQIYQVDQDGMFLLTWIGQNGAVQSMRTDRVEPDLNTFRRTVGREASACPIIQISGMAKYAVFISETIAALPFGGLHPFIVIHPDAIQLDYRSLKRALYATVAVYAIYLTLSMAIPYFIEKRLEKEDKDVSAQSIEWVEKQNEIEAAVKKQKSLADPINTYASKYLLMTLLWKVLPVDAKITQMNVSDTRVEIRGRAPSAADLMTAISGIEGVHSAQFISPVRKDAKTGQETFMIGFEFTGKQ